MLRRQQLIGIAIVVFWVAMMATLFQREVFVPRAVPAEAPSLRPPSDIWMGIYSPSESGEDHRVGYLHTTSAPGERDGKTGTRHSMAFKLAATMLSTPTEIMLDGNAWVADGEGLKNFDFRVQSFGEHMIQASGDVNDGRLNLDVETAGEHFPLSLPVGKDLLVQGNLGSGSLNLPPLEIGEEVLIDTYDPLTMSKGTAHVACVGMEKLWYDGEQVQTKILETTLGGITTKTWVDFDENVMRIETPVGLVLKRISQEEALADLDVSDVQEIIDQVAIRPAGLKPTRGAKHMRFRVSGLPESLDIPTGTIQTEVGEREYVIDRPDAPTTPYHGEPAAPHEPFLRGDPFVQTGHKRILAQTQQVLGSAEDAWKQSQLLYEWVYQNIEKIAVLSFPSALDVLESREGDCNEHTVLYTAMSRTAKIPTRIALGVVWSDTLDGFYYHAWPEVFVGHWVPIDPTLGQPIADATHVKLLEGNIEDWPKLSPFLGRLQIEVLEVE